MDQQTNQNLQNRNNQPINQQQTRESNPLVAGSGGNPHLGLQQSPASDVQHVDAPYNTNVQHQPASPQSSEPVPMSPDSYQRWLDEQIAPLVDAHQEMLKATSTAPHPSSQSGAIMVHDYQSVPQTGASDAQVPLHPSALPITAATSQVQAFTGERVASE